MNSLREIIEQSPLMRELAMYSMHEDESPQPLGDSRWDWRDVQKVLLVRLRSIGDTVLATPSLFALKRFLPHAQVDILLENWVAPVLSGFAHVDNVVTVDGTLSSRVAVARKLRSTGYDVVYNLHGGSTASFLTRASGAKHRVGYSTYRYSGLHNHVSPSPLLLWGREKTHSVEQQLALLGWTGVPVSDRPPTQLGSTSEATLSVTERLSAVGLDGQPFALIHPAAAFATKQWATENFGRVVQELSARGLPSVVIVAPHEESIIEELQQTSSAPFVAFSDLSLPEVSSMASRARIFIGNDSGIAHIAAAVKVPVVIIFGSSNRAHWQPWATTAAEVVYEDMACQPCHGYFCEKFSQPECIIRVPVQRVTAAIDRILRES